MRNVFYILALFIMSVLGYGQVSLLSETNTKEYELKESFKLNIGLEITGDIEQQTPLKLPDLSKFEVLGNASEIFTFIDPDTGVLVKQIIYQLVLEPKQAGKIKIGSALVQVNGKVYKSEPFDIFVKEGRKRMADSHINKDVYLSMEVENADRYAFQPVQITIRAQSKNYHNLRKINKVQLPKNKGIYPINLRKQDVEMGQYPNEMASQVIASFILIPETIGSVVIPSVLAEVDNEKLLSNKLKINVKPLPDKAPKSFRNAVGKFNLEIDYSSDVKVNEPFDVFLKLSGKGNFDQIVLPKVLTSKDYKVFKPKKSMKINSTSDGLKGEIVEHYVLIPKKEGEIGIVVEEFSYFDPQKEIYEVVNGKYSVEVSNVEKQESTIEKMMDNTGHILKKVTLLPISAEKEEEKINWLSISAVLFLVGGIIAMFIWIFKNKKIKNISSPTENKITTIAETEEILKNSIFIEKDYYFGLLKSALEQNDSHLFFRYYDELHNDAIQQIEVYEGRNIDEFLENVIGSEFARDFGEFREKVLLNKYSPMHYDLYELYNNIVKFYSKIMK